VRRYEPAHAAMRPFDTLLCPLVVVVVQDSTDVSRYELPHAAMRPFDTLLCPLAVVQDSTDVSRYEPAHAVNLEVALLLRQFLID